MQYQRTFLSVLVLCFSMAAAGCNGNSTGDAFIGNGGSGGTPGSGGTTGSGGTAGMTGSGGTAGGGGTAGTTGGGGSGGAIGGCVLIICPDLNSYGCGDCMDNDGDGLVDDKDPECLGPCDDTEGPILLTGTPGETGNQCNADCYFDRGNGSGDGECTWNRQCDPLEPKDQCAYCDPLDPEATNACINNHDSWCPETQPDGCADACGALTPNGCDCFGCCTFPELNGGYVFLGSETGNEGTCTLAALDPHQPDLCRPCTPAGNCLNTCERCEICLGKPTIPEDCFPGTGGSGGAGGSGGGDLRCPVGKQACGLPGDPPCPGGAFCLTGCCTEIIVQ